jgi:hypothetical protein
MTVSGASSGGSAVWTFILISYAAVALDFGYAS